jgi:hypothetical protein
MLRPQLRRHRSGRCRADALTRGPAPQGNRSGRSPDQLGSPRVGEPRPPARRPYPPSRTCHAPDAPRPTPDKPPGAAMITLSMPQHTRPETESRSVTDAGPRPLRKYPPLCAAVGLSPIAMQAVQIWASCAPTNRWRAMARRCNQGAAAEMNSAAAADSPDRIAPRSNAVPGVLRASGRRPGPAAAGSANARRWCGPR